MFLQAVDCNLTVELLENDILEIENKTNELVKTANDSINVLNKDLTKQKEVNERQGKQINSLEMKKIFWRAIAIVEGVIITIVTIIILT